MNGDPTTSSNEIPQRLGMFENENDFLKDYVSDLGIVKT
jgi:hypothetical protein